MIPVELVVVFKATALLAIGLVAAAALRRQSASTRHLVLACTLAAVSVLPMMSLLGPEFVVSIPGLEEARTTGRALIAPLVAAPPAVAAIDARQPASPLDASSIALSAAGVLRSAWIFGTLGVASAFALGLWRLRRVHRTAVPLLEHQSRVESIARELGITRGITLLTHHRIMAPITFGVRKVTVMLPDDAGSWSETDVRRALVHELEHVRRFDWGVHLFARAVCAAFWFIPLVWIAERRLRLEAERACDDAVLDVADGVDYADQLVALARRFGSGQAVVTLGMANRSDLSVRVRALLDPRQPRNRVGRAFSLLTAGAMIALLAGVSALQVVSASTATSEIDQTVSRGDKSLYRAAVRGDVDRMRQLIDDGANVNRAFDGDGTPLIGAARAGRLAAVRLLLDRGADPNLAVPGDGTPLIMAARDGHREVVALLLDRGAHINQVVPEDENALIQASASGELEVVQLLIARGADVNIRAWAESAYERPNGEWRTALGMARRNRHDVVAKVLVAAGARE